MLLLISYNYTNDINHKGAHDYCKQRKLGEFGEFTNFPKINYIC